MYSDIWLQFEQDPTTALIVSSALSGCTKPILVYVPTSQFELGFCSKFDQRDGELVRLEGLSNAAMNGAVGHIIGGFHATKGRYYVKIQGKKAPVLVRPHNFVTIKSQLEPQYDAAVVKRIVSSIKLWYDTSIYIYKYIYIYIYIHMYVYIYT